MESKSSPDAKPIAMTLTLKPKTEIVVPKSIRRKAGIKHGDRFEFRVTGRTISIVPKPSPDEEEDERELGDPKVLSAIRESRGDIAAGRMRPADMLQNDLERIAQRQARRGRTAARRRKG